MKSPSLLHVATHGYFFNGLNDSIFDSLDRSDCAPDEVYDAFNAHANRFRRCPRLGAGLPRRHLLAAGAGGLGRGGAGLRRRGGQQVGDAGPADPAHGALLRGLRNRAPAGDGRLGRAQRIFPAAPLGVRPRRLGMPSLRRWSRGFREPYTAARS